MPTFTVPRWQHSPSPPSLIHQSPSLWQRRFPRQPPLTISIPAVTAADLGLGLTAADVPAPRSAKSEDGVWMTGWLAALNGFLSEVGMWAWSAIGASRRMAGWRGRVRGDEGSVEREEGLVREVDVEESPRGTRYTSWG